MAHGGLDAVLRLLDAADDVAAPVPEEPMPVLWFRLAARLRRW